MLMFFALSFMTISAQQMGEGTHVTTYTVNGVSFNMVAVEGGTFTMGGECIHNNNCSSLPAHEVTLSGFSIGETEVTQALYEAVMGNNPSYHTGDLQYPVEQVSWDMCQEFIAKLNMMTGKKFRLPTEAEWEFAARGGNMSMGYTYSGSDNVDDVAWHRYNSGHISHVVGTKQPNELGLYDMTGNVWERVADWYGPYSDNQQTDPTGPENGIMRCTRGSGYGVLSYEMGDLYGPYPIIYRGLDYENDQHADMGFRICLSSDVTTYTVNGVSFNMVAVEGGTFTMGGECIHNNNCSSLPAHEVTLSGFSIGETEVTQALYEAVMGNNPSYHTGDLQYPVEQVSWDMCQEFIAKLNMMTGKKFRLPTEAEWEFAARGGNMSMGYTYSGSDNVDDVAWHRYNSGHISHVVGTKQPNELGLYDMTGNVWERVADWYGPYSDNQQTDPTGPENGIMRCTRGSGYGVLSYEMGDQYGPYPIIYRGRDYENDQHADMGFRIALTYKGNVVHVFGDVDCDGYVTSSDITALYNYLLYGDTTYLETLDVNSSGSINAADITEIYNILLNGN